MQAADPFAMIQTQMMAMVAMKPDSNIMTLVWLGVLTLVLKQAMRLLDVIVKHAEASANVFMEWFISSSKTTLTAQPLVAERVKKSQILMDRTFDPKGLSATSTVPPLTGTSLLMAIPSPGQETMDALIELMSTINGALEVRLVTSYFVEHGRPVQLDADPSKDVWIRTIKTSKDATRLSSIELELWSYVLPLSELKQWVENVHRQYLVARANSLGNQVYLFDSVPPSMQGQKELTYRMTPFTTTKRMDHMFGEDAMLVKERVRFFLNNQSWYKEHGVPYTLGALLHGPGGSGKSSCIKAAASESGRHLFNVQLRGTTRSQLTALFRSERVLMDGRANDYLVIPIDKRLYLFEDIDSMGDVVLDRDWKVTEAARAALEAEQKQLADGQPVDSMNPNDKNSKAFIGAPPPITVNENEVVDLAFLLNLFDGVSESHGRLMFCTTNYPDRLDKALIRPGRIDVNVEMRKCSSATLNAIIRKFVKGASGTHHIFVERVLTVAEAQECIFRVMNNTADGNSLEDKAVQALRDACSLRMGTLLSTPVVLMEEELPIPAMEENSPAVPDTQPLVTEQPIVAPVETATTDPTPEEADDPLAKARAARAVDYIDHRVRRFYVHTTGMRVGVHTVTQDGTPLSEDDITASLEQRFHQYSSLGTPFNRAEWTEEQPASPSAEVGRAEASSNLSGNISLADGSGDSLPDNFWIDTAQDYSLMSAASFSESFPDVYEESLLVEPTAGEV